MCDCNVKGAVLANCECALEGTGFIHTITQAPLSSLFRTVALHPETLYPLTKSPLLLPSVADSQYSSFQPRECVHCEYITLVNDAEFICVRRVLDGLILLTVMFS